MAPLRHFIKPHSDNKRMNNGHHRLALCVPLTNHQMSSWALGDWASTTRLNSDSAGAMTLSENGQEKSADAMNALRFVFLGRPAF
jgi:hypothetical protein